MSLVKNTDKIRLIFIMLTVFICMSLFAVTQPFGDGPDEINRYKIVSYVQNHGTIPAGDAEEIIIDGYGASYGFQPILTYMIEGYLLRLLSPLNLAFETQLIIARYINIIIGLIAVYYTYRLSQYLFDAKNASFLFTLGVALLPQNIFIYTYVNTDGMGLLSVLMICYALLRGYKNDFDKNSYITLAIGLVLCLMSYYNCYGYVLVAFFAFIAYYLVIRDKKDIKSMFIKGGIISAIVVVFAGWWFIRNAILYNGDLLALNARQACAAVTGNAVFLESMNNTYQVQGYSVWEMVFGTDYYTLVWKSFIAMFGPMQIPTHHYVYMAFKYITILCIIGLLIPKNISSLKGYSKSAKISVWIQYAVCMIITIAMAVYYSYTWDFQPQGRYYLPMLVPFAYFLCLGMDKLINMIYRLILVRLIANKKALAYAKAFLYHILYMFFFMSLGLSVLMMLKYYASML